MRTVLGLVLAVGCAFLSAGLSAVWWGYGGAAVPFGALWVVATLAQALDAPRRRQA